MDVQHETQALQRIAAKQRLLPLRRRVRQRDKELRQAPEPALRFPNERKSLIAVHATDAQAGVRRERFALSRRARS